MLELRRILDKMRDRRNVRLHLVGHADTQPLSPALAAVFGDNEGLSRERAGEVAELLKGTLALPAEAISYEWAGDQQPVASNETEAGRAQNRRVEVEVWYDEVKQGTAVDEVLVEEEFRASRSAGSKRSAGCATSTATSGARACRTSSHRCASAPRPWRSLRPTSSRSAKPSPT